MKLPLLLLCLLSLKLTLAARKEKPKIVNIINGSPKGKRFREFKKTTILKIFI